MNIVQQRTVAKHTGLGSTIESDPGRGSDVDVSDCCTDDRRVDSDAVYSYTAHLLLLRAVHLVVTDLVAVVACHLLSGDFLRVLWFVLVCSVAVHCQWLTGAV